MPRLIRRLFALCLLAIWLPATAHCAIRIAADWLESACEQTCSHADSVGRADGCDLVEGGDFTVSSVVAHAPAPSLTAVACLACVHARILAEAEPLPPPAWAGEHPREWVPVWIFALRAAAPARAPDLT